MSKPLFEVGKSSWKKLDKILEKIQNAINERTPLASETIDLDEREDGMQICIKDDGSGGGGGAGDSGGGGSGTPVNLYGAFNGAPALFHLLQSSPPTQPPP